ncbi:hypothetical protein [Prosthecomicrobium sp. N25]|uniref:hypothetical protein n=1 Tax=Prosthecomicrobium sp. N25 TaxID=3129254 RepID=UPI00307777F5
MDRAIFKVAILVWIMLGTTLAGMAVTAVLVTPGLEGAAMKAVPAAGILGYLGALPLSVMVARRIQGGTA